jgi:DNA-binding NtrC family response regulator
MTDPNLQNRRILIVEDEFAIASSLKEYLALSGAVVIGPVGSIKKALEILDVEPSLDAAVLDFNLGGASSHSVADKLRSSNIPFVFTSGYEDEVLRERYPRVKNLSKPYSMRELEQSLADAISLRDFVAKSDQRGSNQEPHARP